MQQTNNRREKPSLYHSDKFQRLKNDLKGRQNYCDTIVFAHVYSKNNNKEYFHNVSEIPLNCFVVVVVCLEKINISLTSTKDIVMIGQSVSFYCSINSQHFNKTVKFTMPNGTIVNSRFTMPNGTIVNSRFTMPNGTIVNSRFTMPNGTIVNSRFTKTNGNIVNSRFTMPHGTIVNSSSNSSQGDVIVYTISSIQPSHAGQYK